MRLFDSNLKNKCYGNFSYIKKKIYLSNLGEYCSNFMGSSSLHIDLVANTSIGDGSLSITILSKEKETIFYDLISLSQKSKRFKLSVEDCRAETLSLIVKSSAIPSGKCILSRIVISEIKEKKRGVSAKLRNEAHKASGEKKALNFSKKSKSSLNYLVDKIYCINLKRRVDRRKKMEKIFLHFGINATFYDAIYGKDDPDIINQFNLRRKINLKNGIRSYGSIGIYKTIIKLIKEAKKNKYRRICIFEDDALLSNDFNNQIKKIKSIKNFNMIYLGASQHDRSGIKSFGEHFYIANKTQGLFAVIIDESCFEDIIELGKAINYPIDDAISRKIHNSNNSYVFSNNIAIADTTCSDIRHDSRPMSKHCLKMAWDLKEFSESLKAYEV